MKFKLKVTTSRTSRMEELVKASNFYAATKFPDRSPHMREQKKQRYSSLGRNAVTVSK